MERGQVELLTSLINSLCRNLYMKLNIVLEKVKVKTHESFTIVTKYEILNTNTFQYFISMVVAHSLSC